jgi:hypothetical protein
VGRSWHAKEADEVATTYWGCGVDVAAPGVEGLRRGVELWLDRGIATMDPALRQELEGQPARQPQADSPEVTAGAPGSAYGVYGIHRNRRSAGGRIGSGTLGGLAAKVTDVDLVSCLILRLDEEGRFFATRGGRGWDWTVARHQPDSDVLRLAMTPLTAAILDDGPTGEVTRAAWRDLVREAAEAFPLLFAFAGPCGGEGETLWEARYRLPSHACLSPGPYRYRGVGWLTALPDWAVARAGGIDALRGLPFARVEPLGAGGAWCEASDDLRDATPELVLDLSDRLLRLVKGDDALRSGPPTWE